MSSPEAHTVWEYATLQVDWNYTDGKFKYEVAAYSDESELFRETYVDMYWTAPLARMGRLGWELVGLNPQNVLAQGFLPGYETPISTPVRMVFFFKRPQL